MYSTVLYCTVHPSWGAMPLRELEKPSNLLGRVSLPVLPTDIVMGTGHSAQGGKAGR